MKERPIIFNASMVRALLGGSKTQTRRVVKPSPAPNYPGDGGTIWIPKDDLHIPHGSVGHLSVHEKQGIRCPYGQPGDRLWVRETFARIDGQTQPWVATDYRASYKHGDRLGDTLGIKKRWTPSIHMPRNASRITLEITGVRIERLQDISEADALAEGAPPSHPSIDRISREFGYDDFPRSWYAQLWESINGPGSWDTNPWVWVIEFKRTTTDRGMK